jgi:hypothetical protein
MLLGDAGRGCLHAALNASCTGAAEAHRLRTMLPLVPLRIGRPARPGADAARHPSSWSGLRGRAAGAHFDLVKPTESMTPRRYSLSFLMSAAGSAGVHSTGAKANGVSRLATSSMHRVSAISRESFSAIAAGVLGGATIASHSTFS